MLSELVVHNLALIEKLSLAFGKGANILTGETGAGKSILAGALSLIRGGKASADLVRAGAPSLSVEALFTLEKPPSLAHLFLAQGLPPSDEIILKRTVLPNGRSRAYVNGSLVTLAQLSQWGEELLAISSQRDQQSLLNPSRQLDFLDAFGRHDTLLQQMSAAYKAREEIASALSRVEAEIRDLTEKKDFLSFQLAEIRAVKPLPGEDDALLKAKAQAKDNSRLSSLLDDILRLFYGDGAVLSSLSKLNSLLGKASDLAENLAAPLERSRGAFTDLDDLAGELQRARKSLGQSAGSVEDADERLSALAKLKRKFGPTLDDVLAKESSLRESLEKLDTLGLDRQLLAKRRKAAESEVARAALALHESRASAGERLAAELLKTLKFLGFPEVDLRVEVALGAPEDSLGAQASSRGGDAVAFLFCPNVGEGLKPLAKIASGGELSRVMLALKTAQEPHSDQTLVFDEIDSGLSGAVAEAVAAKMADLSGAQQVLVITHQPLMAAIPGKHFLVAKSPGRGRVSTAIKELSPPERESELARMLDGASPSPQAIALSKRLLGQEAS
ncbi:MAG: DNA repair protein RecN [Deltaproteobacteria bacterium]|jgi:DNA repair protein RecN (Recombination protein N)|nr:DNA repair protein RecN [Deltaproteobacteria bacterium]